MYGKWPPWLLPLADALWADRACTSPVLLLAVFAARHGRPGALYDLALEAGQVGCA